LQAFFWHFLSYGLVDWFFFHFQTLIRGFNLGVFWVITRKIDLGVFFYVVSQAFWKCQILCKFLVLFKTHFKMQMLFCEF
jgi:hypothetical protein